MKRTQRIRHNTITVPPYCELPNKHAIYVKYSGTKVVRWLQCWECRQSKSARNFIASRHQLLSKKKTRKNVNVIYNSFVLLRRITSCFCFCFWNLSSFYVLIVKSMHVSSKKRVYDFPILYIHPKVRFLSSTILSISLTNNTYLRDKKSVTNFLCPNAKWLWVEPHVLY